MSSRFQGLSRRSARSIDEMPPTNGMASVAIESMAAAEVIRAIKNYRRALKYGDATGADSTFSAWRDKTSPARLFSDYWPCGSPIAFDGRCRASAPISARHLPSHASAKTVTATEFRCHGWPIEIFAGRAMRAAVDRRRHGDADRKFIRHDVGQAVAGGLRRFAYAIVSRVIAPMASRAQ